MKICVKWMLTLTGMFFLLNVADLASAEKYASIKKTNTSQVNSPIKVMRSDKIIVDAQNKFCITSIADETVMALVQRSGEYMSRSTVERSANDTAIALMTALLDAGYPTSTTSGRVAVGNMPKRQDACMNNAATIFVTINVQSLSPSDGYRISLSAKQGRQHFIARISRRTLISMSMEMREGISLGADISDDGTPFWDMSHDLFKLQKALVDHLFGARITRMLSVRSLSITKSTAPTAWTKAS
jgi:hypothetical protein